MTAVFAEHVTKIFPASKTRKKRRAVRDFSFCLEEGQAGAFVGESGAGKTTLLQLFLGLTRADEGRLSVLGRDPLQEGGAAVAEVGLAADDMTVSPRLSIEENLALMGGLWGLSPEDALERAHRVMARMRLTDVSRGPAGALPLGVLRRLETAMALMPEPRILFLDEPTRGLSADARREYWDTLRSLKGELTLCVGTSVPEEAEVLADRVVFLWRGRTLGQGSVEELLALTQTEDLTHARDVLQERMQRDGLPSHGERSVDRQGGQTV